MGVNCVEVVELTKGRKLWYHRFCDFMCLVKWLIKGNYMKIEAIA